MDDILDIEGDLRLLKAREQRLQGQSHLCILEWIQQRAIRSLIDKANEALTQYGAKAKNLQRLASFVISQQVK